MDAITPSHSQYQPLVSIMTPTIRPAGEDSKPRPVGGTARTPGVKTPRKVQWAADEGADPSSSTHALDEHGLDVSIIIYNFASALYYYYYYWL
jgi:hypothetical protein